MGDRTEIEWCDASWNPLRAQETLTDRIGWHCEHVTEACRFCYAEGINKRLGTKLDYKPGFIRSVGPEPPFVKPFLDEKVLLQPLRWKRPRRVFVCSMTDLFGEWVWDEQLDRIFAVMAIAQQHTFILLTKRAERMRNYLSTLPETGKADRLTEIACDIGYSFGRGYQGGAGVVARPLPNVWAGPSCSDQADADRFIPFVLDTPLAKRIVSLEPLLGPIDMRRWLDPISIHCERTGHVRHHMKADEVDYLQVPSDNIVVPLCPSCGAQAKAGGDTKLDWVIVGGESGPNARPCNISLIRAIDDQCREASVPVFNKQLGRRPYWDKLNGCGVWGRHVRFTEIVDATGLRFDAITLRDKKGGDWSEWPEDLRVRQFPKVPA